MSVAAIDAPTPQAAWKGGAYSAPGRFDDQLSICEMLSPIEWAILGRSFVAPGGLSREARRWRRESLELGRREHAGIRSRLETIGGCGRWDRIREKQNELFGPDTL